MNEDPLNDILNEEDGGDLRNAIKRRWPCKNQKCRWYGQHCYYNGANIPKNHVLIYNEVAREWARAIAEDPTKVDDPGTLLATRIWRNKLSTGGNQPGNPFTNKKGNGGGN